MAFGRRASLQQREQHVQLVAQLPAIHDMSIAPFSSRNSARWNPSGSFWRTVCSITRGPAKPISALGLGDDDVAEHREAGRHAAHGRIGEHRDERQLALRQLGERSGSLGHLHERQQAFLHARAARGGEADVGQLLLDRDAHARARSALRPPSPSSRP
jgi:hypothetical protein